MAPAALAKSPALAPGSPRPRQGAGTPIPLQVTWRDLEILRAVNRYRYLRTGQIKRLLFPEAATHQTARRRLQKLAHPAWRYLGRVNPASQAGDDHAEAAFCLLKAGAALLTELGDEIVPYPRSRGAAPSHKFLEHALAISDFRIALELALKAQADISLRRFVHEDELKTHLRRGLKQEAYKLYNCLPHPRNGREYVVHPDALIVLAAGEETASRRLFFLEVDRGTESLGRIRDKITGYRLFKQSNAFRKFGDFADFLVLLVTNSERRAQNMRAALTDVPGEEDVWITDDAAISETTVLSGAVWRDYKGQQQALLRQD